MNFIRISEGFFNSISFYLFIGSSICSTAWYVLRNLRDDESRLKDYLFDSITSGEWEFIDISSFGLSLEGEFL